MIHNAMINIEKEDDMANVQWWESGDLRLRVVGLYTWVGEQRNKVTGKKEDVGRVARL